MCMDHRNNIPVTTNLVNSKLSSCITQPDYTRRSDWLASSVFASQPIRTRTSNIFVFMLTQNQQCSRSGTFF